MISRCPSCGAPAPDDVRLCPGCGWDFVTNKKGEKKPEPPKKAEPPKKPEATKPAGGLALPPARGGTPDAPAVGLGMASLPKVTGGPAASGGPPIPGPDDNPFALPVARNLGPKPGESLFAAPPPPAPSKLPVAKPKDAPPPEPEDAPPSKSETPALPPAEAPSPAPEESAEAQAPSAELSLPSAPKEPDAEPPAADAPSSAPEPEAKEPPPAPPAESAPGSVKAPAAAGAGPQPAAGRKSAVYLAALTGGALGLLSIGAIFMMLRTTEPPGGAHPSRSSPFGKRASGDSTVTPVLEGPAISTPTAPVEPSKTEPVPQASTATAAATPKPAPVATAPAPTTAPAPAPSAATPANPAPAPVAPAPPAPEPAKSPDAPAPKVDAARPTATFAPIARPKPVPPPASAAPKPAPRPAAKKLAAAPQWVFEGTVYDLLSTRGVYGVKLIFLDEEGGEAGIIVTGEGGHYHGSLKAGPAEGYALRVVHEDYSGKHIDELDSTSSVRKADLEQRKFLMQAGARSLRWVGAVDKPVRRDMALVPKVTAE